VGHFLQVVTLGFVARGGRRRGRGRGEERNREKKICPIEFHRKMVIIIKSGVSRIRAANEGKLVQRATNWSPT